jgi:hypothetical protein
LSIADKSALLEGELNTLSSQGWQFLYYQNPAAAPGASSTDANATPKQIDIAPQYAGNAIATVGQLMHEVYHALHPIDYQPADYSALNSYLTTVMDNEGGAQANAIQASQQLAANGESVSPPGLASDVAAETAIYNNDVHAGASAAQIAHDVGQYMLNVSTGTETYQQFYTNNYNAAHK